MQHLRPAYAAAGGGRRRAAADDGQHRSLAQLAAVQSERGVLGGAAADAEDIGPPARGRRVAARREALPGEAAGVARRELERTGYAQ